MGIDLIQAGSGLIILNTLMEYAWSSVRCCCSSCRFIESCVNMATSCCNDGGGEDLSCLNTNVIKKLMSTLSLSTAYSQSISSSSHITSRQMITVLKYGVSHMTKECRSCWFCYSCTFLSYFSSGFFFSFDWLYSPCGPRCPFAFLVYS
jgi:hypothetical protein